jgi:hypothetical protein
MQVAAGINAGDGHKSLSGGGGGLGLGQCGLGVFHGNLEVGRV